MKKVFALMLVSFVGFGLFSCNSDDDNGNNDPVYSVEGRWEVTGFFINGSSQELSCELQGIRQFKADNTYLQEEFISDGNGGCVETSNSPVIGTWNKNGTVLKTTLPGTTSTYELSFVNGSLFELVRTVEGYNFKYTYQRIN